MSSKKTYFDNLVSAKIRKSIQYGFIFSFLEVVGIIILIFLNIEAPTSLFIGSILIWVGLCMLCTGYTAAFLPRNGIYHFTGAIVYLLEKKLPKESFVFWEGPHIRFIGLIITAVGLLLIR